jgi:hypothetical protein
MNEETAAGLPADESDEGEDHEDWRDSLPEELPEEAFAAEGSVEDDESSDEGFEARDRHPLQQRASDLLLRLHHLLPPETKGPGTAGVLMNGVFDIAGGLAQALCFPEDDDFFAGLCVVQLKRSLRGAAFAQGALFPLRADGLIDEGTFKELYATLKGLQNDIYDELRRRREG